MPVTYETLGTCRALEKEGRKMRFPLGFSMAQAVYRMRMKKAGHRRYPTVLMLEPLYTCNLACIGCSVERHTGRLQDRMTVETCLKAAADCGAPIVNICGGEPTLYPELSKLIAELTVLDRYIILCTNALKLDEIIYGVIPPSRRFLLMIHLDGTRETHDFVCKKAGVFDNAVDMVRKGKELGYHIYLNTTVYKNTQVEEVETLCRMVDKLGANGILIAPGYEFDSVESDHFAGKNRIHEKFRAIRAFSEKYKITSTPVFLEFAAGLRELPCSPWSTVNFTPNGWKSPCYLVEGGEYFESWENFWSKTNWPYWEDHQDRRCQSCLMHSGFEHSAVVEATNTFKGKLRLGMWSFLH
jgi:hopanoid biosynthesis associated radical SAM protein HpnH